MGLQKSDKEVRELSGMSSGKHCAHSERTIPKQQRVVGGWKELSRKCFVRWQGSGPPGSGSQRKLELTLESWTGARISMSPLQRKTGFLLLWSCLQFLKLNVKTMEHQRILEVWLAFEKWPVFQTFFSITSRSVAQYGSSLWSAKVAWLIFVLAESRAAVCHRTDNAVFVALSPCQIKPIFWLRFVLVGWDAVQRIMKQLGESDRKENIDFFLFALSAIGKNRSSLPASPSNQSPWDQSTPSLPGKWLTPTPFAWEMEKHSVWKRGRMANKIFLKES